MNWPRGLELYWQHKISWSGVLIIAGIAKVREKKGDHIHDALVVASTSIAVTAIWYPEIRAVMVGTVLATSAAPVAAVAVSTYALGGIIAFAAADPEDEGWYGAEALKEYYHDPIGTTVDIAQEYIVEPVASWTERRIQDLKLVWSITAPRVPTIPWL